MYFNLDLSTFGVQEKLRPMVVDVLKITTVAIVMQLLTLNANNQPLNLLTEDFINNVLFKALGFMFFWMIVYQSVNIKLKQNDS